MESTSGDTQTITISLPAATPQSVLTYLEQIKDLGERTYNKKITQLFIEAVQQTMTKDKPAVIIPLPEHLTQEQQDWFHHPFTKQLIMNWISQLTIEINRVPSSFSLPPQTPQPNKKEELEHPAAIDNLKSDSFQISTSYHNKLVGFFMDDD